MALPALGVHRPDAQRGGERLDRGDLRPDPAAALSDRDHHLGHPVPAGLAGVAVDQRPVDQPADHRDHHEEPQPEPGEVSTADAALLAELGMAMSQLPVLMALGEHGALPQSELVKIAKVEQSSMAQLLSRMERDGLITRVPDHADGRSKLIRLTDQAIAMRPKGRVVMEATSELGLAGLSGEERALLGELLMRVLENLEQGEK